MGFSLVGGFFYVFLCFCLQAGFFSHLFAMQMRLFVNEAGVFGQQKNHAHAKSTGEYSE